MPRIETAVKPPHNFRKEMMRIENKEVAMEVRKREQMTERCLCKYTQQGLAHDETYRIGEVEEGLK